MSSNVLGLFVFIYAQEPVVFRRSQRSRLGSEKSTLGSRKSKGRQSEKKEVEVSFVFSSALTFHLTTSNMSK